MRLNETMCLKIQRIVYPILNIKSPNSSLKNEWINTRIISYFTDEMLNPNLKVAFRIKKSSLLKMTKVSIFRRFPNGLKVHFTSYTRKQQVSSYFNAHFNEQDGFP